MGLAAALAACGTPAPSPPTPSPADSPTPVPGRPVTTAAFATVVPPQWTATGQTPAAAQAAGGGTLLLHLAAPAASPAATGGLDATIDVVELPLPVPDDQLATTLAGATDRGAVNLSVAKPAYVDGAGGLSVTYDLDIGAVPAETEELLVNHAGSTWDITYTAPVASWSPQRTGLVDVLTAWHWVS